MGDTQGHTHRTLGGRRQDTLQTLALSSCHRLTPVTSAPGQMKMMCVW